MGRNGTKIKGERNGVFREGWNVLNVNTPRLENRKPSGTRKLMRSRNFWESLKKGQKFASDS
jgi:hypothetical protein